MKTKIWMAALALLLLAGFAGGLAGRRSAAPRDPDADLRRQAAELEAAVTNAVLRVQSARARQAELQTQLAAASRQAETNGVLARNLESGLKKVEQDRRERDKRRTELAKKAKDLRERLSVASNDLAAVVAVRKKAVEDRRQAEAELSAASNRLKAVRREMARRPSVEGR